MFSAGQGRVESGAQFDECRHASAHSDSADVRLDETIHKPQQRALAGPVGPDQRDGLALPHVKRHVLQGPEFVAAQANRPFVLADSKLGSSVEYAVPQRSTQVAAELLDRCSTWIRRSPAGLDGTTTLPRR